MGLALRCFNGGDTYGNGYQVYWRNGYIEIGKFLDGVWSSIGGEISPAPAINDRIRFEISGTTLTLKYNGIVQTTRTNVTDFTSGRPGVSAYGSGINTKIDNWSGGSLYGASDSVSTSQSGVLNLQNYVDGAYLASDYVGTNTTF